MFYRAMSYTERDAVLVSRRISPKGESFVTQDVGYSRQLAARHPEKYDSLLEFETQPGTRDALIASGARSDGQLFKDEGLDHLPHITKGQKDVVHLKDERDSLTYGLRPGSAHIFNDRIIGIQEIE